MVRKYRKEDGSKVADNFFARVKNQLNKYGQIDNDYTNKNSKDKVDGMILSEHHERIIKDGYDKILEMGIEKYSGVLGKTYNLSWDGIRKEIDTTMYNNTTNIEEKSRLYYYYILLLFS